MSRIILIIFLASIVSSCGSDNQSFSLLKKAKGDHNRPPNQTFYIHNGQLYDSTGNQFIARGVNNTHNYYPDKAYNALTQIKELGFNTVRVVWCADTLIRTGRCDKKDIHPISELEKIFKKLKELKLIGILNLQNATGSSEISDLKKLVDWYTKPEVVDLLERYQDILILNVANEWYSNTDDPKNIYRNVYLEQIIRLRESGLPHVLIIDARGWAQQFSSIPENYPAFQSIDQNILMSVHMFESFSEPKKVIDDLNTARKLHIPLIIGEFSCVHFPGQPIACDTIMEAANHEERAFGYLAWSFSGNSNPLEPLDIVSYKDWRTLSPTGEKILNHPHGIKKTSKVAKIYDKDNNMQ